MLSHENPSKSIRRGKSNSFWVMVAEESILLHDSIHFGSRFSLLRNHATINMIAQVLYVVVILFVRDPFPGVKFLG